MLHSVASVNCWWSGNNSIMPGFTSTFIFIRNVFCFFWIISILLFLLSLCRPPSHFLTCQWRIEIFFYYGMTNSMMIFCVCCCIWKIKVHLENFAFNIKLLFRTTVSQHSSNVSVVKGVFPLQINLVLNVAATVAFCSFMWNELVAINCQTSPSTTRLLSSSLLLVDLQPVLMTRITVSLML